MVETRQWHVSTDSYRVLPDLIRHPILFGFTTQYEIAGQSPQRHGGHTCVIFDTPPWHLIHAYFSTFLVVPSLMRRMFRPRLMLFIRFPSKL